jgi:uncharacterized protein (DUF433 family)
MQSGAPAVPVRVPRTQLQRNVRHMRAIVRTPEILSGRWSFAGTNIAVADVRQAYAADPESSIRTFRRLGLTRDDIHAAFTFPFPDVRPLSISQDYASVTIHCVCGEDTPALIQDLTGAFVHCTCGRHWRIGLTCEPAGGQ